MAGIAFEKYECVGDNFVFINNVDGCFDKFWDDKALKTKMCDPNFGIGCNAIIELRKHKSLKFEMVHHSTQGNPSQMCGNGSRALIAYVSTHGLVNPGEDVVFNVYQEGEHVGKYNPTVKAATVSMRDIPIVHKLSETEYFANSGLPHLVVFGNRALGDIDIVTEGQLLSEKWNQYATDASPVLVNFVHGNEDNVEARCYDAANQHEILSCGTATTAIGVCYDVKSNPNKAEDNSTTMVKWRGGLLQISYRRNKTSFTDLHLTGPVNHVFSGTLHV